MLVLLQYAAGHTLLFPTGVMGIFNVCLRVAIVAGNSERMLLWTVIAVDTLNSEPLQHRSVRYVLPGGRRGVRTGGGRR